MNREYIIRTKDWVDVRDWFVAFDYRLRSGDGGLIRGAARRVGRGLFAVSFETSVGSGAVFLAPNVLLIGGLVSWLFFESLFWSVVMYVIAGMGYGTALLTMSPFVHVLMLRKKLSEAAGRNVPVEICTREYVRGLAYGKGRRV